MCWTVQSVASLFLILGTSQSIFENSRYQEIKMNNERIVSILNGLIDISRDGAAGFRTCADDTDDVTSKVYFQNRAQSCDEAVRVLSAEVRRYGGTPDT